MSVEESKLRSLSSIAGSLKDIVRIMTALNENLVEFAKQSKPAEVEMSPVKLSTEYYKELAKRSEGYAAGAPEFKKEGE
jgi:hypothetical protein